MNPPPWAVILVVCGLLLISLAFLALLVVAVVPVLPGLPPLAATPATAAGWTAGSLAVTGGLALLARSVRRPRKLPTRRRPVSPQQTFSVGRVHTSRTAGAVRDQAAALRRAGRASSGVAAETLHQPAVPDGGGQWAGQSSPPVTGRPTQVFRAVDTPCMSRADAPAAPVPSPSGARVAGSPKGVGPATPQTPARRTQGWRRAGQITR